MANEGSERSIRGAITVSSGSGSLSLTPIWLNARWVRIKPVAETDSYDVTISDGDGILIASRTGQIGTMSEQLSISLGIAKTIAIANASQDGTYEVRLDPH
jgi:hypothetical protein